MPRGYMEGPAAEEAERRAEEAARTVAEDLEAIAIVAGEEIFEKEGDGMIAEVR